MSSVKNVRRIAKGKKQTPASESIETQDARFAESTVRRFVEAIRAGRELPNRDTVPQTFLPRSEDHEEMEREGRQGVGQSPSGGTQADGCRGYRRRVKRFGCGFIKGDRLPAMSDQPFYRLNRTSACRWMFLREGELIIGRRFDLRRLAEQ